MTPLHLDILEHYYTRRGDYDLVNSNKCRRDYAYELAKMGLLYTAFNCDQTFFITDYGREIYGKVILYFTELTTKDE